MLPFSSPGALVQKAGVHVLDENFPKELFSKEKLDKGLCHCMKSTIRDRRLGSETRNLLKTTQCAGSEIACCSSAFIMAKFFPLWPFLFITFLMVSCPLISARGISPGEISFVQEPDDEYFIVKKSPVVIVCQARNAAEIIFTCVGTQVPPSSVEVKDVSDVSPDLIQSEIEVTQADVQNHEGSEPFWCECSAADIDGQLAATSKRGFIYVASLKNKFKIQPKPATATAGDAVEFACGAPEGVPAVEYMWRKDKKRLDIPSNPRYSLSDKNSLVIDPVSVGDKGLYQCVVKNLAGRRESDEVLLTVTALPQSAETGLEFTEEADTVQKSSGASKPRTTRQSIKTYFTIEPQEKYYVTESKPVLIDCGVVRADIVTFRCNGKRMERDRQALNQGLDATGTRIIQSQLTINYTDVQAFLTETGGSQKFQCICVAWFQETGNPNGWGKIDSNSDNGFIYLGYLDRAFQIEPSDVTAGLGTDVTLICEPPKGQPSPWVYWYKERTRLDPRSSDKYSVNSKGHLTIHKAQYEDAGSYNCLAENSATSVQSRAARVTVTADPVVTTAASPSVKEDDAVPSFPPVIPRTPVFLRDYEAENTLGADGTVTLICAVVPAEQMTVDCGGARLAAEEYQLKLEAHRETGKRLIQAKTVVTAEKLARNPDNFFCQCTAWYLNEQGTWGRVTGSRGFVRAATAAAYIEDEFAIEPSDTDAYFESDAQLTCQAPEGNPTPTVYWLKDGVRINPETDPNFVFFEEGTLTIEYVRTTDEGEYVCVAENEAGVRKSPPIKFTVLGKPTGSEDTKVTQPPTGGEETDESTTPEYDLSEPYFGHDLNPDYYIVGNEPVTLGCTVIAAKTLVFVCNGEIVKESVATGYHYKHPQTQQAIRENSLTLSREKVGAFTGTQPYTCSCRAFYPKDGSTQETAVIESSYARVHIAFLNDYFPLEPSDTEVALNARLELPCLAPSGFPEPKISWVKNNAPVTVDEHVRVESSGTLVIEHFGEGDEGIYQCVANNTFITKTSQSALVSVVDEHHAGKPEPETGDIHSETSPDRVDVYSGSPYISKDLHTVYYIVKGKPVTINCEAYGVESISFTCGMQTVAEQETKSRMEELLLRDGQTKLVKVTEASVTISKNDVENYTHGTEYWCQCYGHYTVPGMDEEQKLTSTKGVVETAYLKKNFQKEPESQTVTKGESLTILCQPPFGNPPPKVSWTKDGEHIEELSITPSGVLIFPEAQLEHTGEYICVAENEAGKRMSKAVFVEVKDMDDASVPEKEGGGSHCAQLLSSCLSKLPRNIDNSDFCTSASVYIQCVDNYINECSKVVNEDSMNAVKMAYKDVQKKCTAPKCPQLEECKAISSNSPDNSADGNSFTVHSLCTNPQEFSACIDNSLPECSVTMNPPKEDEKASLHEVADWLTDFCNTLQLSDQNSRSCAEFSHCDLQVDQVAADNSSYWCRFMNNLTECARTADKSCSLHMNNEIEELHSQVNQKFCHEDIHTHLEPRGEGEPTGETHSGSSTDGDEDDDEDDNGKIEGAAEASKEDLGNGSVKLGTSVILATILQLLIVVNLSRR